MTTMLALAMALPTLYGWWPLHPMHYGKTQAAGWRLTVSRDRFDGAVSCRIWRHAATYAPGVVVLHLGPNADTSRAEYRIDDGAPWAALHTLEALGSPQVPNLHTQVFNPSGGDVLVPEAQVVGAHEVEVRPEPKYPVVYFHVDGLAKTLADARNSGCGNNSIEGAR